MSVQHQVLPSLVGLRQTCDFILGHSEANIINVVLTSTKCGQGERSELI